VATHHRTTVDHTAVDHTAVDHTALAVAEARASAWPDERLPCPACATALAGRNLARHLAEKHPGLVAVDPGGPSRFSGVDRRIRRWYWVGAAALLAALGLVTVRTAGPTGVLSPAEQRLAGSEQLRLLATSPFGVVLVSGLAAIALLAVADHLRAFRATVSVEDDEVVLRHRMGTGTIRLDLADVAAETGALYQRRSSHTPGSDHGGAVTEVHAGSYLRLATGRRGITVGCTSSTGLRKHWRGAASGPRRKVWDVTLPAPAYVALQYALADHAVLGAPNAAGAATT
jgi:hypothetical protein